MIDITNKIDIKLWKLLPYEIKLIIYVSILNYENKRKRHKEIGYGNVIDSIDSIKNNISIICNPIQDFYNLEKTVDELEDATIKLLSIRSRYNNEHVIDNISYDQKELIKKKLKCITIKYNHLKKNNYLSDIYFLALECEKLKSLIKNLVDNSPTLMTYNKIIFDSEEILQKYGKYIYVYYLNENNEWVQYYSPLEYRQFHLVYNIEKYQTIMITHIDITDQTIDNKIIQEVIKNPLFKFNMNELIKLDFKISEINPIITNLFVK